MGLIPYWLRFGEHVPRLANFATSAPVLRTVAKRVAGVAPQRQIPQLADQTFSAWFRDRQAAAKADSGDDQGGGQRPNVILWPDTFTDHFHPATAKAAVRVLEAAGYSVTLPDGWVCCGRPLYDWGLIDQARSLMRRSLSALAPALRDGTPIVGLEPSCVAAFRHEVLQLYPNRQDAKRLATQTYMLTEFLDQKAPDWKPPHIEGDALVHGHCHQKAVMGLDFQTDALRRAGLDVKVPESGCCGMAGAFGFERGEKYDVAIAAGERVLLPAVRQAAPDTLIVAAGFSCREQIAQTTDRRALHPAEVLADALDAQA